MTAISTNFLLDKKNKKNSSNNNGVLLMPKAVATWLVDNTSLTFHQIAAFCNLHYLEVKLIADKEADIKGCNPIEMGQITEEEINNCQNDPNRILKLNKVSCQHMNKTKFRYTPIARRRDKPDAICWIIKYHPEMSDAQIVKLIGTTKSTIISIRNKAHWKMSSIKPRDPVLLGLCSQDELDNVVLHAKMEIEKAQRLVNVKKLNGE